MTRLSWTLALALALIFASAGTASALNQFSALYTPTARVHSLDSGEPGVEWDTGGLLAGGQVSYDSGTGILTITGGVQTINYFDPGNGSCASDVGSNCAFNLAAELDVVFTAEFDSIDVVPVVGPLVNIIANFRTTGVGDDLTVTDPLFGNSVTLSADLQAGTFNGGGGPITTSGLTATVLYNTLTGTAVFDDVNSAAFLAVLGGEHASLFQGSIPAIAIDLSTISDWNGVAGGSQLDLIAQQALASGKLPSLTAELNGAVFRAVAGEFTPVPEPSTALLLAGGLAALAARRRGR